MIGSLVARARSLWRGLRHRSDVEAEMHEEFRFHVDARVEDLVGAGLSRAEAIRRASIEFGSFERYKDEARASRGLKLFDELALIPARASARRYGTVRVAAAERCGRSRSEPSAPRDHAAR